MASQGLARLCQAWIKFGPGRLGLAWRGDARIAELLDNARCGQERLGS